MKIYLDYNATTPIDKEVADAMRPYLESYFGNPSSAHSFGIEAKLAVEKARQQVAALINCEADEIIFTSGGTESNNYSIKGIALANKAKGNHIITSKIEHPATIEVCKYLENNGFEVTYLDVDEFGMVIMDQFEGAIRPDTILVSIMHANNEVGTIQPIAEIAEVAKQRGIYVHTDAAQSLGKIEVDVKKLGVDLLSVAGHKVYAPKGIGVLYKKRGVQLEKLIHGANHEMNMRAGTENVLEIVGLGKACEIANRDFKKNHKKLLSLRERLWNGISDKIKAVKLNGHPDKRLPNTLNISFKNIEANTLLAELENIAASAGAACHSDDITVSHVLEAMQVPIDYAMGTIRFSTGKSLTETDIDKAIAEIVRTVKSLQGDEPELTPVDVSEIKLTSFTHGLGCACKLRPQVLEKLISGFAQYHDKNVLVGTDTSDDAAVYKMNEEQALVQTVDFFTPVVNDPYHFGAIAAANALSDVYAMGAKPVFGLNIVGFPSNRLPIDVLNKILKGAQDKCTEAGISILGGHTIDDVEPKFGMVVSGLVHPDKIWKNSNAKAGDKLILTKPIGTGILATALKRGAIDSSKELEIIEIMAQLNKYAFEVIEKHTVHACTDVTGFGLLGHLLEITKGSKLEAELYYSKVPKIAGAEEMASAGIIPGGTENNLLYVNDFVKFDTDISEVQKKMLADAQTSGGLLVCIPEDDSRVVLDDLNNAGIPAVEIGALVNGSYSHIYVHS